MTALQILREHTGLTPIEFAIETGISKQSVYNAEEVGYRCGPKLWEALERRWELELRQLGLECGDFVTGRDLPRGATDPVTAGRRAG